jgi:hypothetical protein
MEIDKEFLEKLVSSAPELRQEYQRYQLWRLRLNLLIFAGTIVLAGIVVFIVWICGGF